MPKIVDYEKRKNEIMKEAVNVFVLKGYHNTSLMDIAGKCDMGRTTLYQYFGNKEEIFYYAIKHIIDSFQKTYKDVLVSSDISYIDKIKNIIFRHIKEYQNSNAMVLLIDLWVIIKKEKNVMVENKIREYINELRDVFSELLQAGIENNEIKPVNKDSMAFILYALIEIFMLQFAFNNDITLEEHMDSVNVLIDGLRA